MSEVLEVYKKTQNGEERMLSKSQMVDVAKSMAEEKHKGQEDRYGNPYIDHIYRVVDRVMEMEFNMVDETSEIELYVATAYLHDIIEDTMVTDSDLREEGFTKTVREAVHFMTRPKRMSYSDYLDRIKVSYERGDETTGTAAKIAKVVKLADLFDHLMGPTPCPTALKKRYEKSIYSLIGFPARPWLIY